ncbi:MAG: hypothetical protein ACI8ZM_004157 [Crocinitomix sp.]
MTSNENKKDNSKLLLLILENIKFSSELFWLAYQKAIKLLNDTERNELNNWIYKNGINRKVIIK